MGPIEMEATQRESVEILSKTLQQFVKNFTGMTGKCEKQTEFQSAIEKDDELLVSILFTDEVFGEFIFGVPKETISKILSIDIEADECIGESIDFLKEAVNIAAGKAMKVIYDNFSEVTLTAPKAVIGKIVLPETTKIAKGTVSFDAGVIHCYVYIDQMRLDLATSFNKTKEELKKIQKKLITQAKLAELGSLAAGIAHELKNPINIVVNSANIINSLVNGSLAEFFGQIKSNLDPEKSELLLEDLEDLRKTSQMILESSKRADDVIKNMLMQSNTGKSELEEVEVGQLVTENLELVFHAMRATKPFKVQINKKIKNLSPFMIYRKNLARVFINVFENAFYAMREKSDVTSENDYIPILNITLSEKNDMAELAIRDNGIGISKSHIEKVLIPFFTTKKNEGTGLGLSMANDIVTQKHEDDFLIESEEGRYTEIIIKIPLNLTGVAHEQVG